MNRAPSRWAYAPAALSTVSALVLIITQALGAGASLAERITWLAVTAVIAAAWAYQISATRTYIRLYRSVTDSYKSVTDSYEKCAASRDYWKSQVEIGAAALTGEEPRPSCIQCGQRSQPVPGGCGHEVCGWCRHCPACVALYRYRPFTIT